MNKKSAILQTDTSMQKMLPIGKSLRESILNMKKEHTGVYRWMKRQDKNGRMIKISNCLGKFMMDLESTIYKWDSIILTLTHFSLIEFLNSQSTIHISSRLWLLVKMRVDLNNIVLEVNVGYGSTGTWNYYQNQMGILGWFLPLFPVSLGFDLCWMKKS